MDKNTRDMVRLGLFVTLGTILFIAGVYFLGNSKNLFGENFTLFVDFRNVHGLQAGNNVRFSGITVGSVSEIEILDDSTLRVEMIVEDRVREFIKKDAIAFVGTDGLVGAALVDITPGGGKLPPVDDGDIIHSSKKLETGEILHSVGKTVEKISVLSQNLVEITDKINMGEGTLGILLNEKEIARDLEKSIESLRNTGGSLASLTNELNQTVQDAKGGKGMLGYLLTDSTLMPQVAGVVDRVDSVFENQAEPLFADLKKSIDEINTVAVELNKTMTDINAGKGAVGTLLKDEATDKQIRDILSNVNESSAKLNENMEALKHNWFFRRYFKKKAKEERKSN